LLGVDATTIYLSAQHEFRLYEKHEARVTLIGVGGTVDPGEILGDPQGVYFSTLETARYLGQLHVLPANGDSYSTLFETGGMIHLLGLQGETVYVTRSSYELFRIPRAGGSPRDHSQLSLNGSNFILHEGTLYWSRSNPRPALWSRDLSTQEPERELLATESRVLWLGRHDTYVYWLEEAGLLRRALGDGSAASTIAPVSGDSRIALTEGPYVYWMDNSGGVWRAAKVGGEPATSIARDATYADGYSLPRLVVDETSVYWLGAAPGPADPVWLLRICG
jgi:hypothetical protein